MECDCSVAGRAALEYDISRPDSLPSRHREGAHTCSLTPQTSIPHGIQKTADLCGPTRERQSSRNLWAMCSACSLRTGLAHKHTDGSALGSVGLWKGSLLCVVYKTASCQHLRLSFQAPSHSSFLRKDRSEGVWLAGGMPSLWASAPQFK